MANRKNNKGGNSELHGKKWKCPKYIMDSIKNAVNEYEKKFDNKTNFETDIETNESDVDYNPEPKYYAPEWRDVTVKVRTLGKEQARKIPITDLADKPYTNRRLRKKKGEPIPT